MFCLISEVLSALMASVWEKKSKAKKKRLSSKEAKEVFPPFMYKRTQIFPSFSRKSGKKFVKWRLKFLNVDFTNLNFYVKPIAMIYLEVVNSYNIKFKNSLITIDILLYSMTKLGPKNLSNCNWGPTVFRERNTIVVTKLLFECNGQNNSRNSSILS